MKGKENVVADALSRVPGMETVNCLQVCSRKFTLGLLHIDDLGSELDM